ncbi:hypothetical protein [uncultured Pseudoteredinibacter sp.]|uniref:hypothetical protein n=1 Tax=uncultured Pseudoteredinibacter sp. TaxID=1641701 RepID=UPI00263952BA|nr:hypothetical protein [uncultured Pseudoteredinibacter sp.]
MKKFILFLLIVLCRGCRGEVGHIVEDSRKIYGIKGENHEGYKFIFSNKSSESIKGFFRDKWLRRQIEPISVCFMEKGNNSLKNFIRKVARLWEIEGTSINFTFKGNDFICSKKISELDDIRISFSKNELYSKIGLDSENSSPIDETMILGRLVGRNLDSETRRWILHEFGHALGFYHEHQSPGLNCEKQLEMEKLSVYVRKKYGWDDEDLKKEVSVLSGSLLGMKVVNKNIDSVMSYTFPKRFYKVPLGDCYADVAYDLTESDVNTAKLLFALPVVDSFEIKKQVEVGAGARKSQRGELMRELDKLGVDENVKAQVLSIAGY